MARLAAAACRPCQPAAAKGGAAPLPSCGQAAQTAGRREVSPASGAPRPRPAPSPRAHSLSALGSSAKPSADPERLPTYPSELESPRCVASRPACPCARRRRRTDEASRAGEWHRRRLCEVIDVAGSWLRYIAAWAARDTTFYSCTPLDTAACFFSQQPASMPLTPLSATTQATARPPVQRAHVGGNANSPKRQENEK